MELFLCPLQYHRYPEEEFLPVISRWKVDSRWKSNMALKPIILNEIAIILYLIILITILLMKLIKFIEYYQADMLLSLLSPLYKLIL